MDPYQLTHAAAIIRQHLPPDVDLGTVLAGTHHPDGSVLVLTDRGGFYIPADSDGVAHNEVYDDGTGLVTAYWRGIRHASAPTQPKGPE